MVLYVIQGMLCCLYKVEKNMFWLSYYNLQKGKLAENPGLN